MKIYYNRITMKIINCLSILFAWCLPWEDFSSGTTG